MSRPKRTPKVIRDENLYVAYFRVSTDKQGERGLGIMAQRDAVDRFLANHPEAVMHACFTEVESGRKTSAQRPGLQQALDLCDETGATLIIAKLDRLARNVSFISSLMDSNTNFVALDYPAANRLVLHIMAAVAEHEAEMIRQRTRAGLQAAKARGAVLGNPQNLVPKYSHLDRSEAAAARQADAKLFAQKMEPTLRNYLRDHYSLNKIAAELNRLEVATASGLIGAWTARSVKNCLGWLGEEAA